MTVIVDNKMFSLSEWYQKIGAGVTDEFRVEDNTKHDRLEALYQETGLIYDRPDRWQAIAVKERRPEFLEYLEKNKNRLCAFRLLPLDINSPKLRQRGKTVAETLSWFDEQEIDFEKYNLDIVPHNEVTLWSGILIVTEKGVMGELTPDALNSLSFGYSKVPTFVFKYDFNNWQFADNRLEIKEVQSVIERALTSLKITDLAKQDILKNKIKVKFFKDYLLGYFEFIVGQDNGLFFADFNRLLPDLLKLEDFSVINNESLNLNGVCAYSGHVQGVVVKIAPEEIGIKEFPEKSILVCKNTMPEYLPLMEKASAIITDQGGILSHAAIISRELKIPCLVGTKIATQVFNDGDELLLDTDNGSIIKLNN
jgi:phosphohistidine swiveling domain-containing protein